MAVQYAPGSAQVEVCDGFDVLVHSGIDTSRDDYYDGTSGALVAVVSQVNGLAGCAGGPADFVPPSSCSTPMSVCAFLPDGGWDAELGGFDAADSADSAGD